MGEILYLKSGIQVNICLATDAAHGHGPTKGHNSGWQTLFMGAFHSHGQQSHLILGFLLGLGFYLRGNIHKHISLTMLGKYSYLRVIFMGFKFDLFPLNMVG